MRLHHYQAAAAPKSADGSNPGSSPSNQRDKKPKNIHMKIIGVPISLLVLTGLFALSPALALTPGPTIIRSCPGCHEALSQFTIGSGNTIGAKFWTDGKMEAPMLPDRPQLVKCPKCSILFWVNDAKELGRSELWLHTDETKWDAKWNNAPAPDLPSREDLLNYANTQKLTKEREIYVRERAWWLTNDPLRHSAAAPKSSSWSDVEKKNLRALSALLDEAKWQHRHLKAEIERELGNFRECQLLLNAQFPDECPGTADQIRKLSEENDRVVREIR
jgi:hypothetical protein